MVAFDHRGSLKHSLSQLRVDSGPLRRAELKQTIWRGISEILDRVPAEGRAAILIDRGHDRIAAQASDAGVAVAVALEASGHRLLRAEASLSALGRELKELRASLGKVLVRWHPDEPGSSKRRQLAALRELGQVVCDAGAHLLLELLVPPAPHGRAVGARDTDWEEAVLPQLQLAAAEEILASGIAPALWKIEGHPNAGSAAVLAELVGSARPGASILVLGGGSEIAELPRLFSCCRGSERFNGFAVGRSIWWTPISALCRGEMTEAEARWAVGHNFLAVVDVFESAIRVPTIGPEMQPDRFSDGSA